MADRLPFSEMGTENPESLLEDTNFENFKSTIHRFLDDEDTKKNEASVASKEKNVLYFLKEEKKNYFSITHSKIIETKNNFLLTYTDTNRIIENMTRKLMLRLKARELQLKAELQQIAAQKLSVWDKQLLACEEALKSLNMSETSFTENHVRMLSRNNKIVESLKVSEAGDIKFEVESYPNILRALKNIGKFCYKNSVRSEFNLTNITPKFTFGCGGNGDGEFCRPWGVCSDPTGRILVCDRSNHRIQIFNECGEFILRFGKEGSGPGEFNRPTGIDVDDKCRIVVADKDNHRIQIFSFNGHFLFTFGAQGTELGQFMYPWDVSAAKGRIAVSDSKNHRIQLFNDSGLFLAVMDPQKIGIINPRLAMKYLDSPRGLTFLTDGSLLVTDFNNHKILHLNSSFDHVQWMGAEGFNLGQFFRPQGIAFDGFGKFAVSDSKNYRVEVFDMEGHCLKSFGSQGTNPGQFNCPQGICFHPNRSIIVVDLENSRVQVF